MQKKKAPKAGVLQKREPKAVVRQTVSCVL